MTLRVILFVALLAFVMISEVEMKKSKRVTPKENKLKEKSSVKSEHVSRRSKYID